MILNDSKTKTTSSGPKINGKYAFKRDRKLQIPCRGLSQRIENDSVIIPHSIPT